MLIHRYIEKGGGCRNFTENWGCVGVGG